MAGAASPVRVLEGNTPTDLEILGCSVVALLKLLEVSESTRCSAVVQQGRHTREEATEAPLALQLGLGFQQDVSLPNPGILGALGPDLG